MAFSKTKYLSKKFLDHAFGKASFSMPGTVYLALFKSNPTVDGTLTDEVTGGSYSRVAITSNMASAILGSQSITNASDITFSTASADWGEVTHAATMDASTSGNMLYFGPLSTSRFIQNGDVFSVLAGQLVVQDL